jgi:hypothetical protein
VSRVIWKYVLKPGLNRVLIRGDAFAMSVGAQGEDVVLWACVRRGDDSDRLTEHRWEVALTGHEMPSGRFIGTAQQSEGVVVHVFEHPPALTPATPPDTAQPMKTAAPTTAPTRTQNRKS